MKNFTAFLLAILISCFCFVEIAKADGEVNIETFEDLYELRETGGVAKLQADITMTNDIRLTADLVLDLNGHELNTNVGYTLIALSNLTVKDTSSNPGKVTNGSLEGDYEWGTDWQSFQVGSTNGSGQITIESGVYEGKHIVHIANGKLVVNGGTFNATSLYAIGNSEDGECEVEINGGTINYTGTYQAINAHNELVTINGGTIKATAGSGIVGWKDAEVVFNDGTIEAHYFAISGNGSMSGTNEGTNAKFTINGGSLKASNGTAIYAPQVNGVTVINGGTITGSDSAIEIRAGKLTINGGTLKGNVDEKGVVGNTNGTTTTGAAVSVVQHTTKQPIEVNITGGTFTGYVALNEANAQNNSAEDIAKITINVTGGTFTSTGDKAVYSEDLTGFISGGKYSTSVTDYVKEGYQEKTESNMVAVYKVRTVTLTDPVNGTVTLSKTTGLKGDEVKLTITPSEGYLLESVKVVDSKDKEVTVTDDKFTMPDDDVTVTVKFIKVVTTEVDTTKEVDKVTIGVTNAVAVQELLIEGLLNDEELLTKTEGTEPTVELITSELELTNEVKKEILDNLAGKEVEVLGFYDISIAVKDKDGNELGNIAELSKEVEIVIMLPKTVQTVKDGYERTYYVVREHEGKYELLKATLSEDGTYITVKTNKFSTYALAYEDVKTTTEEAPTETTTPSVINPKTGDAILMFAGLGLISLGAFTYIAKKKKLS